MCVAGVVGAWWLLPLLAGWWCGLSAMAKGAPIRDDPASRVVRTAPAVARQLVKKHVVVSHARLVGKGHDSTVP